jgi:hypothetical protein
MDLSTTTLKRKHSDDAVQKDSAPTKKAAPPQDGDARTDKHGRNQIFITNRWHCTDHPGLCRPTRCKGCMAVCDRHQLEMTKCTYGCNVARRIFQQCKLHKPKCVACIDCRAAGVVREVGTPPAVATLSAKSRFCSLHLQWIGGLCLECARERRTKCDPATMCKNHERAAARCRTCLYTRPIVK